MAVSNIGIGGNVGEISKKSAPAAFTAAGKSAPASKVIVLQDQPVESSFFGWKFWVGIVAVIAIGVLLFSFIKALTAIVGALLFIGLAALLYYVFS